MATTVIRHRYRVTDSTFAGAPVGTILVDKKKPEGKDEQYPAGYRVWHFVDGQDQPIGDVTAEYLGTGVYRDGKLVTGREGEVPRG